MAGGHSSRSSILTMSFMEKSKIIEECCKIVLPSCGLSWNQASVLGMDELDDLGASRLELKCGRDSPPLRLLRHLHGDQSRAQGFAHGGSHSVLSAAQIAPTPTPEGQTGSYGGGIPVRP